MRFRPPITRATLVALGAVIAVVVGAGAAAAQTGCNFSDCTPQGSEVTTTTTTSTTIPAGGSTTTTSEAAGGGVVGQPGSVESSTTSTAGAPAGVVPEARAGGGLPVTGQDVMGLFLIGLAAIALGAGMARSGRGDAAEHDPS